METEEIIRNSISKDALFYVHIHKILNIHYGQTYHFIALQFGLATAPLEFMEVVKEAKIILQAGGIQVHQYLDHQLLRVHKIQQYLVQTNELFQIIQQLCFVIHF